MRLRACKWISTPFHSLLIYIFTHTDIDAISNSVVGCCDLFPASGLGFLPKVVFFVSVLYFRERWHGPQTIPVSNTGGPG